MSLCSLVATEKFPDYMYKKAKEKNVELYLFGYSPSAILSDFGSFKYVWKDHNI